MKASVFVGVSVDGFLARPDDSLDFLPPDGGEPHGYHEFMATVDCLVIGRKTYEVVLAFDPWPYGAKPVFVLSSRGLQPAPAGAIVEPVSPPPRHILSTLARRGFRHAYIDGGETIQSFLDAGAIDALTITRVPVLIGRGKPLFGATLRDVPLEHVKTDQYASGLVKSEYRVLRDASD